MPVRRKMWLTGVQSSAQRGGGIGLGQKIRRERGGVVAVGFPVLEVESGQSGISDGEKIFGIRSFSGFGEVERAGEDPVGVHDDDFVMSNRVAWIDPERDTGRVKALGDRRAV